MNEVDREDCNKFRNDVIRGYDVLLTMNEHLFSKILEY